MQALETRMEKHNKTLRQIGRLTLQTVGLFLFIFQDSSDLSQMAEGVN